MFTYKGYSKELILGKKSSIMAFNPLCRYHWSTASSGASGGLQDAKPLTAGGGHPFYKAKPVHIFNSLPYPYPIPHDHDLVGISCAAHLSSPTPN